MPGRDVDTALRVVHDLTQALWFGGATMGAVAIDAAASEASGAGARVRATGRAWRAWHRVSTPAVAAHLLAGAGLTLANRGRLAGQRGAARTQVVKTALTGVALTSEVTARALGRRLEQRPPHVPTSTEAPDADDEGTRSLRRRLAVAQWTTVATTGALVVLGARMGEQQRPRELVRGVAARLGLAA